MTSPINLRQFVNLLLDLLDLLVQLGKACVVKLDCHWLLAGHAEVEKHEGISGRAFLAVGSFHFEAPGCAVESLVGERALFESFNEFITFGVPNCTEAACNAFGSTALSGIGLNLVGIE